MFYAATQNQQSSQDDVKAAISSFFFQRRALEQLRDSLTLIPLQKQSAYREALVRCPQLVETESDPMQFLHFANFNFWSAAERLVTYWEKRREVFGERAFLPLLDLSGNGALTAEDVQLIVTGSFLLTAEDTVVVDRSLEPECAELSIESQIRRNVFLYQLLAQHQVVAMQGCKFVVRYKRFKLMDQRVAAKSSEICTTAFPIRIKAVHMVFAADFQLGFIQNAVSLLCKLWGMSSCNLFLHHCETPELALMKLVPHGLLPSALPLSLGGTYNLGVDFVRFLIKLGFTSRSGNESSVMCDASSISLTSSTHSDHDFAGGVSARHMESFKEAMNLLPDTDKSAYLLAMQRVPDLVEDESPPTLFMEFSDCDAWAAATRLCNYWKHRFHVFGDRALLPLTLKGAMGPDGEKAAGVGVHYLLQNDKYGRTVWCAESFLKMDSDPEVDYNMRAKMYFYIASKIFKNPNSVRNGVIGIPLISEIEIPLIDPRWIANLIRSGKMFKECFPIRPAGTQVIYKSSGGPLSNIVISIFLRLYSSLLGDPVNIHVYSDSQSLKQLQEKFEAIGITKEGLPKKVGGQQGPAEFLSRQQREENRNISSVATEVNKSAIKAMRTALSCIQDGSKVAYLEAANKCPNIADQESVWECFLRFTDCDATKAATMYANYWEVRKELFGDRAVLPLNQTFEGVLERKDVAVLQTGYFMQLPCVESGESVLYVDGTKLQRSSSSLSRARCKFYMLSIMAENPLSQTRGFNLLYFLSDPSFDRVFKDHFFETILPVMPIRVNHVHVLALNMNSRDASHDDGHSVEARLKETMHILDFQRSVGLCSVDAHIGTSREDLLRRLVSHGYSKEGLPKTVFGELSFDDFVKWQELRVRYEWGLFTNSREQEQSSKYLIPRNKLLLHEEDSEKVERKRRMTIILSRRKRERERMSLESLQEEAMEQTDRNRKLQRQNEVLQNLLEKANDLIKNTPL
ncbi:hypothetical protein FisN_15Lu340 [Fistulifera solaris]|uniref:CRAL-TRIO domain-containing protein n=1 Tax=Fistulifera solaris TaxID=1519565 RepID=A0A1Z5JZ21_FISSO|nr:hypothetical protein FisN_15Lu340 [Fistulifera solaris]|eukprot:GAX19169.1 hypothetical protein FisN_15Lu340 [Fistulifera solaris]